MLGILLIALYLTTSRIALLGGLIISLYFIAKKIKKNILWVFVIIAALTGIVIYIFLIDPFMLVRMSVSWDRIDIFKTTIKYLAIRPIFGFGGNTIDQLVSIFGNFSAVKNWGHTHNWFLEVMLRYGLGGAVLFSGLLLALFIRIKDMDKRMLYLLLLATALFQTYMREFVFIFFLNYLSTETKKDSVTYHEKALQ